MWTSKEKKYSSRWKWVETARWVDTLDRVIRDKDRDDPKFIEWSNIHEYAKSNQYVGIYSSLWRYDVPDLEEATRLGSIYFDLDSNDTGRSYEDAQKLYQYFLELLPPEAIRFYFTGLKGFHVEAEALAVGVSPSNDLPDIFRHIAKDLAEKLELTTLDFQVYDLRRMWRVPYTRHQKTGLHKFEVRDDKIGAPLEQIKEWAKEPEIIEVPKQKFSMVANQWYREYIYEWEESKKPNTSLESLIDRFNQHGTSTIKSFNDEELEFDPPRLFKNCPAIERLWEQAEQEHDLPHEARLFLCSILSYTDEAIWYLHQVLQNCHDYDPKITQAHIDDWIRRREMGIGGRPVTCAKGNAWNVGCGDCELEPRKQYYKVGNSYVEGDDYSAPSPVRYAYSRKRNKT